MSLLKIFILITDDLLYIVKASCQDITLSQWTDGMLFYMYM